MFPSRHGCTTSAVTYMLGGNIRVLLIVFFSVVCVCCPWWCTYSILCVWSVSPGKTKLSKWDEISAEYSRSHSCYSVSLVCISECVSLCVYACTYNWILCLRVLLPWCCVSDSHGHSKLDLVWWLCIGLTVEVYDMYFDFVNDLKLYWSIYQLWLLWNKHSYCISI